MGILDYIERIKRENEGPRITAQEPRIGLKPGGIVEPGVTHYARPSTSPDYIEKGIHQRANGNYRIVASRKGAKKLDKTLPKGSTLEDARKALTAWEKANPIKVKWKEGQKIKIITEGPAGKQVDVDIVYKTPKIEADFKAAMADFAGENKGGWSKAKFNEKFGNISQDAMQFVREQDPTLIRDMNKIQTLKYADELEKLGHKDWNAAIKAGDDKLVMSHRWHKLNPYDPKGSSVVRNQLAQNIDNLNKFEKSGQTLEDFYEIFKDRSFKKNLRAYMKGEAGPMVTDVWDEAGFKNKFKNIIPKLKKHTEVWHEQSDPLGKTKSQIKVAKIKEFSRLDVENLIKKAKRVGKTDYDNILDLAHRQDLVIDQNISELGIERPEINRVLIKDAELERNKLHKKNYALVEEIKKGKDVQKNLSLIAENNHRIQQISNITKGRLTGIIMDTETLAPIRLKPNSIMGVDAGIFNKPIKEITEVDKIYLENKILPAVIDEARAMTPEKIASELSGIMEDEVLSKKLEKRIKNLEPGRQITQSVFEQSKKIHKLMEGLLAGGFGGKCPGRGVVRKGGGGRIGFANAEGALVNCVVNDIRDTLKKAKGKGAMADSAKLKIGKAGRILWTWGLPIDIAIETAMGYDNYLSGDTTRMAFEKTLFGLLTPGVNEDTLTRKELTEIGGKQIARFFADEDKTKELRTAFLSTQIKGRRGPEQFAKAQPHLEKVFKGLDWRPAESLMPTSPYFPRPSETFTTPEGREITSLGPDYPVAMEMIRQKPGSAESQATARAKEVADVRKMERSMEARHGKNWRELIEEETVLPVGPRRFTEYRAPKVDIDYVRRNVFPGEERFTPKDEYDELRRYYNQPGQDVHRFTDRELEIMRKKYLNDVIAAQGGIGNYATGGLANLTRTVARDSGPMQGLASTPEYDTYRKEYKWQT